MKKVVVILIGLMLLFTASIVSGEEVGKVKPEDTTKAAIADSVKAKESDRFVISYLHMNRRCMKCGKLEAYSEEAVSSGFAEQLKDSSIVWRVANFQKEGNEHYAKDYQLYVQSLIISRLRDGKEIEWKNLDKIWQLVGDKEKFIAYVQTEVKDFMKPADKE
ncbi:MAG: hypothetical protein JSU65_05290 [Candidatus Zixiibacteriota bacterium]|nr:MAG: hypothetical protein JSU65_05290 [candidate division Zixibacteria bacterium]